jgi:hypothetical protein
MKLRTRVVTQGERLLGSLRLIQSAALPIDDCFTFNLPKKAREFDRAEISRLVVERNHPVDDFIPRNLIMLLLIKSVVSYAKQNDLGLGVAYVKQSLLQKLRLLRFPIHLLKEYKCIYPKNGPMIKYFSDNKDPARPAFFYIEEVDAYVSKLFHSRLFLQKGSRNVYQLRQDMFNSVLKTLGIL